MSDAPQVYLDHLTAVTTADAALLRRVWEPDGLLEFPYSTSITGDVIRLEGIEAIVDRFGRPGGGMFTGGWTFRDVEAWPVADSRDWVLEMHGSSVVAATGKPYEQDYVVRFGLSEGGRLAWMREFWDPTRV
jgi:ketosteroid isomerase-like protein